MLIDEFHQNISLLASRMESQIQSLEAVIRTERGNIERELERQRKDIGSEHEKLWLNKLGELDEACKAELDGRLQLLEDNEIELNKVILADSEALIDLKYEMEDNIRVLTDQMQAIDALNKLNEVRDWCKRWRSSC